MGQLFIAGGGGPLGPNANTPVVLQVIVTPGYFDAIGMTLLAGRQFDQHDGESKEHPVAINAFWRSPPQPHRKPHQPEYQQRPCRCLHGTQRPRHPRHA